MASRGEQLAERIIQDDLACLACGYNLRGLHEAVIHCPECGVECDIARMIANRWTGPWQRAPGYPTLIAPLAWLVFASMALLLVFVYEMKQSETAGWLTALGVIIILGEWTHQLHRAWRVFNDERGVWLALLTHLLFAGYLAGIALVVVGLLRGLGRPSDWTIAGMHVLMVAAGVALFVGTRRGERFIAEQCIRQYVLQRSAPEDR
jgi:predicted RNA-binding Zn-ribbon protein involved in translation (DUF1610 family)